MKKLNLDWIDALLIAFGMVVVTAVFIVLNVKLSYHVSAGSPRWNIETWGDFAMYVSVFIATVGPVKLRRTLFGVPPAPVTDDDGKVSALSLVGLFVVLIGTLLLAATGYIAVLHPKDWAAYVLWIGIFAVMVVLGALCLRAAAPAAKRAD